MAGQERRFEIASGLPTEPPERGGVLPGSLRSMGGRAIEAVRFAGGAVRGVGSVILDVVSPSREYRRLEGAVFKRYPGKIGIIELGKDDGELEEADIAQIAGLLEAKDVDVFGPESLVSTFSVAGGTDPETIARLQADSRQFADVLQWGLEVPAILSADTLRMPGSANTDPLRARQPLYQGITETEVRLQGVGLDPSVPTRLSHVVFMDQEATGALLEATGTARSEADAYILQKHGGRTDLLPV